jgi:hypothetical protein
VTKLSLLIKIFEFAQEFTADLKGETQETLAFYCKRAYEDSAYAQANLARHFCLAMRYAELIEWQTSGHMEKRIEALSPHQEDAFPEIRYGLTAAIEISRFDDALKLLAHAAIVAQGRDVFAQIVTQFVDTAVRFGYCHRLLQHLERNERGHELARCQFQIAAMLARLGVEQELASDLIRRGFAAIQQEDARLPEARRRGFSGDDVRDIALYGVATSKWTKRQ